MMSLIFMVINKRKVKIFFVYFISILCYRYNLYFVFELCRDSYKGGNMSYYLSTNLYVVFELF